MPVKPKFEIEGYILDHVDFRDERMFRELWAFMSDFPKFEFDGATRYPDQQLGLCWLMHDVCYYFGGFKVDRLHADQLLKLMLENRGKRWQAKLVYYGMRKAQRYFRRVNRLFNNHDGDSWKKRIRKDIWSEARNQPSVRETGTP